jgi:hypothetical protein
MPFGANLDLFGPSTGSTIPPVRCGRCHSCCRLEALRCGLLSVAEAPEPRFTDELVRMWNDAVADPCEDAVPPAVSLRELASHYKALGVSRGLAWSCFVRDTILLPVVAIDGADARELYAEFDAAPPRLSTRLAGWIGPDWNRRQQRATALIRESAGPPARPPAGSR